MSENEKKHDCNCDHEHDEPCDCGCEEMEDDIVMLEDVDGTEIPFYHIATVERDGKEYAFLQEADEDDDPVIEIFELEEVTEGEESYFNFIPVDDELYDILYKQLEEEIDEMSDDDECDDPDCHCHHDDDND